MADEILKLDQNGRNVAGGLTNNAAAEIRNFLVDPSTGRLLVDATATLTINSEKAEDAQHVSGATGSFVLAVRNDAAAAITTTDGDYSPFAVDSAGRLGISDLGGSITIDNNGTFAVQAAQSGTWNITNVSGTISLPTGAATSAKQDTQTTSLQLIDDPVYAEDTASQDLDKGFGILAIRKAAPANTSSTDGDYEFLQMSAGRLWVDPSGVTLTVASHAVTNAGTFATQENGGALTSLQLIDDVVYAEDVASANADKMIAIAAKRLDTPVANANVSGDADYLPFITDNLGKLWTADNQVEDAAHTSGDRGSFVLAVANEANTARAADGDYIAFATDTEGNVRIVGNRDHDAVDAGETVKIGYYATNANITRVANADRTHGIADLAGRQITNLGQVRELRGKQTTTISASTSETTIVTAAASTFNDLVALIISNTSASTNTRIDFRDDTAGTILFSIQSPGNDVRGFVLPGVSIPQTTVNKNWTAQCGTSTTDIRILALFEKNT